MGLSHNDITLVLLALAVLLGAARVLGEVARAFDQPAVLGELVAGILLGPTLLGRLAPGLESTLFPSEGPAAVALQGMFTLAVVLFLLVAGMEVDLSMAFRQGRTAITVSVAGLVVPFALGFAVAWFGSDWLMEVAPGRRLVFALFFATALSISALPVIVKILKDLDLLRTDMGVVVVAAAIVNDLIGWMIFAVVLGMMGAEASRFPVGTTMLLTLLFAGGMLTVGRWGLNRLLPMLQAHLSGPAAVFGFTLSAALLCAAFTEWIGIHGIFGAFLFGVALGDSRHLRQRTRATLDHFISYTFAPIFFASIGLRVDFIGSFALVPVLVVFVTACAGKMIGCTLGGRMSGLSKRESLAVGSVMNARGAMEIILGLLALQFGVIDETMFVALVIMALATSMLGGGLVKRILKLKRTVHLTDFMSAGRFLPKLEARSRRHAIEQLVAEACRRDAKLERAAVLDSVWAREELLPTGIENRMAIPHARVEALAKAAITVGIARGGVDFDSPDGKRAELVFLILTPAQSAEVQLEILSAIGRMGRDAKLVASLLDAESPTEFLALLKAEAQEG